MGLAAWGALAGAAKGAEKGIDVSVERENARIDEQRQIRLAKLQDRLATERDKANRKFQGEQNRLDRQARMDIVEAQEEGATERTGMTVEGAMDRQVLSDANRAALQAQGQAFDSAERELDRGLQRELATLSNQAKLSQSMRERFKRDKLKTTTEVNGVPMETEVPAIFDQSTARWYVQEGNRFISANPSEDNPVRMPKDYGGALKALYENPDKAPEFLEFYGWIPADMFAGQGYTESSSSASTSETTARE